MRETTKRKNESTNLDPFIRTTDFLVFLQSILVIDSQAHSTLRSPRPERFIELLSLQQATESNPHAESEKATLTTKLSK